MKEYLDIKVIRTKHLLDKRGNNKFQRDYYITDNHYKIIVKESFKEGLTSFRNKGKILITIKDYKDEFFCILCSLEDNNLYIISVYKEKSRFWVPFRNITQRINCLKTYLPKIEDKELVKHQKKRNLEKIDVDLRNEYDQFKLYMKDTDEIF